VFPVLQEETFSTSRSRISFLSILLWVNNDDRQARTPWSRWQTFRSSTYRIPLHPRRTKALKLCSNPTKNHSQTYELTVKYFKSGTAKELLMFQRDLNKIIIGQIITAAPYMFALASLLISGVALTVFDRATVHDTKPMIILL
jgi:hypothetical protein